MPWKILPAAPTVGSDAGLAGGDLAERIKSVPCKVQLGPTSNGSFEYICGHRDALHAAAKLAAKEEADRTELVAALRELVKANEQWNADVQTIIGRHPNWSGKYLNRARAALAKAEPANNQIQRTPLAKTDTENH